VVTLKTAASLFYSICLRSFWKMKLRWRIIMTSKRILLSIFFLCLWFTAAHSADPVYPDHPKDIRLTGALLAPSTKEQEDIVTVNIFLGDTPRLLRVGSVENLSPDEKERAVDAGILMRQVRFYGPDELIHRLEQPDIVG